MLDWLGDVTSTVSFCQLSGGVCYPMNLCINCMLHIEAYQTYDVCKLCILYHYFVCVLNCLLFRLVLCINFTLYGISILIP